MLFIAGAGRSGSTLLGQLLGQLPGFVTVGEMVSRFFAKNLELQFCGCGAPMRECPFWSQVAARGFGSWDAPDLVRARVLEPRYGGATLLPLVLLLPWAPGPVREPAVEFAGYVSRLFRTVAEVSGCPVVVDGSKDPAYGVLLHRALGPRLRLVHLVRNANGVAYSWTKLMSRPLVGQPDAQMTRYEPARIALRWLRRNLMLDLLRTRTDSVLLRYEDLAREPAAELSRPAALAGVPDADVTAVVNGDIAQIRTPHTFGGNPMRFAAGPLSIRTDAAWRTGLPRVQRLLVTAVALPLLARYGYLRRGGS